jgi:hypothetical protein
MGILKGLAFVVLGCLLFLGSQAKDEWHLEGIGNVKNVHYYYEGADLQGIVLATEEGVIAFLDHKTGNIKWRIYPISGLKLHRFVAEGKCKA